MSWASTRRLVLRLLLVCVAGCSTVRSSATAPGAQRVPRAARYCDIVRQVLKSVVRPYDQQPLGLDASCVKRLAAVDGKIYVDARFSANGQEPVPAPDCSDDRYAVRFDPSRFQPSRGERVVLISFWSSAPDLWEFNAVVEMPDWPRRRPESMSMSECGSAFGRVEALETDWRAVVTPPPRSRDAL